MGRFRSPIFTGHRSVQIALVAGLLGVVYWAGGFRSWFREPVDFNADIRPILNGRCVVCHGGVRKKAELSLLFRKDALMPTESGKLAIVPGDPGSSELIRRIQHSDPGVRMPPDGPPLTGEEVSRFRDWISDGALWEDHWAYVAPVKPELPAARNSSWVANDIDYFVLAKLEENGLQPAPEADCPTLLRRLSLDLTGLPPTVEEVGGFCESEDPGRLEVEVDRLLESPHFGERWAAFWLDLARYADSKGYEKDQTRIIWRYRDWVIRAFNRDLPFDRFTIEQLAGDLMPEPSEEQLIATAFHRNTMTNDEGGTDDEEFRVAAVMDRVNTTSEVWLGTTLSCSQCHDHPYDPFRQKDYYHFFAFFNNTLDADRENEEPNFVSFPRGMEKAGGALFGEVRKLEEEIEKESKSPEMTADLQAWEQRLIQTIHEEGVPALFEEQVIPADVLRIVRKGDEERSGADRARMRRYYASISPALEAKRAWLETNRKALEVLKPVRTPIMREAAPEESRRTYIFDRGNFLVPGESVEPAPPESLPDFSDDYPSNRLGLARWLVNEENPLTARVTVNRFWEQLFGTGLVVTLEDFGTRGDKPSHAELLDWLALRFSHEHEWSVKSLLKEIVMSATYRQSSEVSPDLLERDPHNHLLSRGPRFRLSAEQIRDQALFVSGLLSPAMFGPSVMPPQPEGIWSNPYSGTRWQVSDGQERYRRALYTFWRRTTPYPSMVTFDTPSREFCVSRRLRTNTPLQALVTLNDPVYFEAAQGLAQRMQRTPGKEDSDRLKYGFRLAMLRDPAPPELDGLETFYLDALQQFTDAPEMALQAAGRPSPEEAALVAVANVILNLDGFLTRN